MASSRRSVAEPRRLLAPRICATSSRSALPIAASRGERLGGPRRCWSNTGDRLKKLTVECHQSGRNGAFSWRTAHDTDRLGDSHARLRR
jgi:hypothetical protein